jgi:NAD(P)H-dependent FMN reductase
MARILLVSGSTRGGSTNTALLRTAVAAAPPGIDAVLYDGMTALPHFNPDDDVDPLPAAVADLRAQIGAADAVLICTPEYAGALPGTFKNLLDWSVGGPEMYGKPVAWVNASGSPTRARHAHESLATVLGYIHADVVTDACAHIPVARNMIGADDVRRRIATVVETLDRYAATRPEWDPAAQSR